MILRYQGAGSILLPDKLPGNDDFDAVILRCYFAKVPEASCLGIGRALSAALSILTVLFSCSPAQRAADTILFNGKIITVDTAFSIADAVAIRDGKILVVGSDKEVRELAGDSTKIIDLKGHTVIPGLNEGHAHPIAASTSETGGTIPVVTSVSGLLTWIHSRAVSQPPGSWIIHPKFFFTRLKEMRRPTLQELDSVAPNHPVFLDGSYGGLVNTKAIQLSDLSRSNGKGIVRDGHGQPTGVILRTAYPLLAMPKEPGLSHDLRLEALRNLLHHYNEMGITSVCSGGGSPSELEMFKHLESRQELTVRVFQNIFIPFSPKASLNEMRQALRQLGYKTGDGDEWVRVGALKAIIDGGILTGTAFLREPWGERARTVFGVSDPLYRGELSIHKNELVRMITAAREAGWKFTAHVTGGGGVDTLLAAYDVVNGIQRITAERFSIIHGNFFTEEAIAKMAAMGIYADMQPAWFYLDAPMIRDMLGEQRLKTFHPYHSLMEAGVVINGGSDHMVKMDPNTSINPYNPFLAMWSVITRKTRSGDQVVAEEAITREEALRMYTINNAYASFEENIKGSIEVGKVADLVVLSADILTCPEDRIRHITPLMTMMNGEVVAGDVSGVK